ncbi:MAG: BrnT family toxin [Stellaceae bacterium]
MGQNRQKHGFDFAYAVRIFDGTLRQFLDPRPWGELRLVATGQVDGRFITVVYTRRGKRYRIISARPARSNERF